MTRLNFYDIDADQRLCYFRWVDPPILSSPEYALKLLREDIAAIEAFKEQDRRIDPIGSDGWSNDPHIYG